MATATTEFEAAAGWFATANDGPRLVRVARRGPVLRPSPTTVGTYGLDMTAGCIHGCGFCHIRGSSRFPGEDKVLFDPFTSERLAAVLDALESPPERVVLSPASDPLPPSREVRSETFQVVALLLSRRVPVQIMTRGRFSRKMVDLLAGHRDLVKVALGVTTLDRVLSRSLEPRAASPGGRIGDLGRLVNAGVDVEVRLEPLIPGLTDTRENVAPLFRALARAGARKVVAHYLFLHSAMTDTLDEALQPLGRVERLRDDFEGGQVFRLGTLGPTKHLPLEARRSGLTRLFALGAEHGLWVTTGASQNPDLPRLTATGRRSRSSS